MPTLLKEAFQQLWEYNSSAWAGKFLDKWCRQTIRSRIEPMKKVARSLRKHRELILNYFRAQKLLSSGVVEGLNDKPKVTMRKSYGFRTFRVLEPALYHSLGKLPEPESTHYFFCQPKISGATTSPCSCKAALSALSSRASTGAPPPLSPAKRISHPAPHLGSKVFFPLEAMHCRIMPGHRNVSTLSSGN